MPRHSRTIPADQWPWVLRTWASIGADLALSRSGSVADWGAVERLITAVRPKLNAEAKQLQVLLRKSRKRLAPLGDPFDLDLGLHRWLGEEREEAYSDWLEWVVRQATTPERIFRLLGLGPPRKELLECQQLRVKRECWIPHGHVDREGRLDLVIRNSNQPIIVVEVKTGNAEDADTAKHEGYCRSLDDESCAFVLLAVCAEKEKYEGFTFLSWADVCIEMRRLSIELSKERRVTAAAMVLAFVAAVEQNLLGFSAKLVQRICDGSAPFSSIKIVEHMERFLNNAEA